MTIVKILGGLGNQMFQYAFAYALLQTTKNTVKLDIASFETYDLREYELALFNVSLVLAREEEVHYLKYKKENLFQKIVRKLQGKSFSLSESYYKEPHFNYDQNVYNLKDDIYFEGYWQSEKYFKKYRDELLKEFTLKEDLHKQSQIYQQDIEKTESVSLHIRRGDYIANSHTNSVHGTCSLDYYERAVKEVENSISSPHFFIFSDDLPWARENLGFIENITFIDLDEKTPDHEEMILMSKCKHNIIANSSFSWWGAWLNQNSNKIVIAPKKWFNEILVI